MPIEPLRLKKLDPLADLSDEDVMERCAQGSEAGFRTLVQRYRSRIMNLVCRFINDRDRAEEIAQEVFLRVFRNRERYRKSGKFSTWIFTIAVNLTKNEIRSRVRRGASVRYWVPDAVLAYLNRHGLYRNARTGRT